MQIREPTHNRIEAPVSQPSDVPSIEEKHEIENIEEKSVLKEKEKLEKDNKTINTLSPPAEVKPSTPKIVDNGRDILEDEDTVDNAPVTVMPTPKVVVPTPKAVVPTPNAVMPTPKAVSPKPSGFISIPVMHVASIGNDSRKSHDTFHDMFDFDRIGSRGVRPERDMRSLVRKQQAQEQVEESDNLLKALQGERNALERDMRVFGESHALMSDDEMNRMRDRMSRRVSDIYGALDTYKSNRSGLKKMSGSMFGESGKFSLPRPFKTYNST